MTRLLTVGYVVVLLMIGMQIGQATQSSSEIPKVGKPLPAFTLNHITHYKLKKATNGDFRGKWLFLDFWFTGCKSCIKSFPKVSGFQERFESEAVFMLVGLNDQKDNNGIEQLYERFRERQGLVMSAAYDSVLVDQWGIGAMPYIIVVDPGGVVRAITDGRDMTAQKIRDIMDGKEVSFFPHGSVREQLEFDMHNAFGTKEKLIYQSILTRWNGESQHAMADDISHWIKYVKADGLRLAMVPLDWLYFYAYAGMDISNLQPHDSLLYATYYPFAIHEVADPSPFKADFSMDVGKGTYNYFLRMPPERTKAETLMQQMQTDLRNAFGYEAAVEIRKVPVWKIIAQPGAAERLNTKGGTPLSTNTDSSGGAAGFTLKNHSIGYLLQLAMHYIRINQPPYFNETGITHNIDITMDCDMTNREAVIKELQRNGLDLVMGEKEMKVVVIRDSKSESENITKH